MVDNNKLSDHEAEEVSLLLSLSNGVISVGNRQRPLTSSLFSQSAPKDLVP